MANVPWQPPPDFNFSDASTSFSFIRATSVAVKSLPSPALTPASSNDSSPPLSASPSLLQLLPGTGNQKLPRVSIQQFIEEKQYNQNLPPILYRAYNQGTRGVNSKDEKEGFKSERLKHTAQRVVLQDMTREDFRASVVDHINNVMFYFLPLPNDAGGNQTKKKKKKKKKKKQKRPQMPRRESMQSIWLSTSSSLLTTLQRARWQVQKGFPNVTIAAIDTGSLRKPEFAKNQEFICSVPELCSYLGHAETRRFIKFNCNEEYLVLNQIQCKMSHVVFDTLYDGGIRTLLPALEHAQVNQLICEGLQALRQATFSQEFPLSASEVELCRELTKFLLTGQRCNLVFYALLSLKRRPRNDPAIDGIAKEMLRGWREHAGFHPKGQVRIENLLQFRFEFDFTRPHQSSHEEIVQFAQIGQHLTKHNQAYERIIGKKIMSSIWDEYGDGISQLDAHFHIDRGVRPLMGQLMKTKRELNLWTYDQLCANEDVRQRVIQDLRQLRKWSGNVKKNKPTSAGATKARQERVERHSTAKAAF